MKGSIGTDRLARVRGGSMNPLVRPGARVLLESVEAGRLRRGDIVSLRPAAGGDFVGGAVLHRYLGRGRDGRLVARGDHARRADPPALASRLDGRAVAVETRPGRWGEPRRAMAWAIVWVARMRPRRLAEALLGWLAGFAYGPLDPETRTRLRAAMRLAAAYEKEKRPKSPPNPTFGPRPATPVKTPAAAAPTPDAALEIQRLGDEFMVYAVATGDVHVFNRTGHWVWCRVREGWTPERMVAALLTHYPEAAPARVRADMASALDALVRAGLLPTTESA